MQQGAETLHDLHAALTALVPEGVAFSVDAVSSDHGVFSEEEPLIARAVRSRRCEFAAGRRCARAALLSLGCSPAAIGRGPLGEPLWPSSFAGSITHGRRFAAAVAYRASPAGDDHAVDLVEELDANAFLEIAAQVVGEDERRLLGAPTPDPRLLAEVFSAKEAAIKILSPRLARYVDFRELVVAPAAGGWGVQGPGESPRLVARQRMVAGVLVTLATAPPAR